MDIDINISTLIFTLINFVILVLILKHFFWSKLQAVIEERQNNIDEKLMKADEDSEKATRQWEDTFDKKGTEFVKEYYTYDDVKKDIRKITVREVETLLRELGYSQNLEIIVR